MKFTQPSGQDSEKYLSLSFYSLLYILKIFEDVWADLKRSCLKLSAMFMGYEIQEVVKKEQNQDTMNWVPSVTLLH